MTTLGLCTHFTETDEWAFDYAFQAVQKHSWQFNICHWLHSPFLLRRDVVDDDLFHPKQTLPVTPELLTHLEYQLRSYYDPKLGDYTQVAFKLCEGQYQVELARCFHKHQLDLVVMGYQTDTDEAGVQPLEDFASKLSYPLILIGNDGPDSFLLNQKALEWIDLLDLTGQRWAVLEATPAGMR
jgi:hypothetical protein